MTEKPAFSGRDCVEFEIKWTLLRKYDYRRTEDSSSYVTYSG